MAIKKTAANHHRKQTVKHILTHYLKNSILILSVTLACLVFIGAMGYVELGGSILKGFALMMFPAAYISLFLYANVR